jgi:hypothetical protein
MQLRRLIGRRQNQDIRAAASVNSRNEALRDRACLHGITLLLVMQQYVGDQQEERKASGRSAMKLTSISGRMMESSPSRTNKHGCFSIAAVIHPFIISLVALAD